MRACLKLLEGNILSSDDQALSHLKEVFGIESHLWAKALWWCYPSNLNIVFVDVLLNYSV